MLPEVFNWKGAQVRTLIIEGDPWWVAADVCEVLGLKNPRSSAALLDDDERGVHTVDTPSGLQDMTVVNEPGLYSLILRSRKPEAKAFKKWVTHEVIPTIRKTGSYNVEKMLADPRFILQALEQSAKRELQLQARVEEMEPKAEFYDAVGSAINAQTIQEVAKIMGTGPNRMFARLKAERILMGDNLPYQRYIDAGYFKVLEKQYRHPKTNEAMTYSKTLVTGKGFQWLQKRLQDQKAS